MKFCFSFYTSGSPFNGPILIGGPVHQKASDMHWWVKTLFPILTYRPLTVCMNSSLYAALAVGGDDVIVEYLQAGMFICINIAMHACLIWNRPV